MKKLQKGRKLTEEKGFKTEKKKILNVRKKFLIKERRNTLTEIWPKEKLVFDQ